MWPGEARGWTRFVYIVSWSEGKIPRLSPQRPPKFKREDVFKTWCPYLTCKCFFFSTSCSEDVCLAHGRVEEGGERRKHRSCPLSPGVSRWGCQEITVESAVIVALTLLTFHTLGTCMERKGDQEWERGVNMNYWCLRHIGREDGRVSLRFSTIEKELGSIRKGLECPGGFFVFHLHVH